MTNLAFINGNLTQDAHVGTARNGKKFAILRVATNKSWRDENGEWQKKPTYHKVTLFGYSAEKAERRGVKGASVTIHGELDYENWEKDGVKHLTAVIVVGSSGTGACEFNDRAVRSATRRDDDPLIENDQPNQTTQQPSAGGGFQSHQPHAGGTHGFEGSFGS